MQNISWKKNRYKIASPTPAPLFDAREMQRALHFHQTIPGYLPTPLLSLKRMAAKLDLGDLFVKDESSRFGLNAFKGLGSSYAMARLLAEECGEELSSFSALKQKIADLPMRTFATATDGNHGRGLAWTAQQLGQRAMVYMPKGASPYRLAKIRELGAEANITDVNYDDTVRYVKELAQKHHWTLMQDTAWDGYTAVPLYIMQGYLTMVAETLAELKPLGAVAPTHVFLQAGVGSFPAAIAACLQQQIAGPIVFVLIEPTRADCFYQSALSNDGLPKKASGDLSTMMAGLSCGEPNPIAWDILKQRIDCFLICSDQIAAQGMRALGNPLPSDGRIVSGESGAVPMGVLLEICRNPALADLKAYLKLDGNSRVFFISTEGDTDPENYQAVMSGA